MVPDFHRVDDVLPKDVATWTNGGHRIEIHTCHPDGESGVFLSEGLSGIDGGMEKTADEPAYGELNHADEQGKHGDEKEQRQGGVGTHDIANGHARGHHEAHSPQVETEVGMADDGLVQPVVVMTHPPTAT